jgi:hypothetical protein
MIVPALITAGILGGIYFLAPREGTAIRTEDKPTRVIPQDEIPTQLQMRMQNAFVQLPPQLQQQLPTSAWGNPALWTQAAAVLNQLQPGSPQSPELLAIANALRALPVPQPIPQPTPPGPPLGTGPIPVPPALQTQLNQVLTALPPPFNAALPSFPFPGQPSTGPLAPSIDPAQLIALAQQIEAALPGRTEPAQLRAIAAQLASSRPVMGFAAVGPNGAALGELRTLGGVLPVAQEAAQTYRDILALRDQFRGTERTFLHPSALQRRRYARGFGY